MFSSASLVVLLSVLVACTAQNLPWLADQQRECLNQLQPGTTVVVDNLVDGGNARICYDDKSSTTIQLTCDCQKFQLSVQQSCQAVKEPQFSFKFQPSIITEEMLMQRARDVCPVSIEEIYFSNPKTSTYIKDGKLYRTIELNMREYLSINVSHFFFSIFSTKTAPFSFHSQNSSHRKTSSFI
jgi:hypothetical protein